MAISLFGSALIANRSSLVANLNSHTALCSEGGGDGRKDGDEDVEDFTPGGVVVESSHSVSWFLKVSSLSTRIARDYISHRNIGLDQINLRLFSVI